MRETMEHGILTHCWRWLARGKRAFLNHHEEAFVNSEIFCAERNRIGNGENCLGSRMKRWGALGILAAAAWIVSGCAEVTPLPHPLLPEDSGKAVKIGVLLPLTGKNAEFGRRTLRGIELSASEINNGRGISNRRVELLVRDTTSDPAEASRQAALLFDEGVIGLVGPYSTDEALAIKPVVEEKRIPTVVPLATGDEVTKNTDMMYRVCFTDTQQGEAIAAYIWYWRKLLRLAILICDDKQASYSRNVAHATANAFTELGGEVVQMVEFQGDHEEFARKLRELVSYNPQAILVPAEPANAGLLVRAIREFGYHGLLLGPESWDEREFFRNCGADPGDCAFVGLYSEEYDLPEQFAFRDLFRQSYFVFPSSCEAQGYDALKLLAIGLGNATSVQEFNRNMQQIRNVPGASALYTMKPHGGIDRTMFIKTIRPASGSAGEAVPRLSRSFNMRKIEQLKED